MLCSDECYKAETVEKNTFTVSLRRPFTLMARAEMKSQLKVVFTVIGRLGDNYTYRICRQFNCLKSAS